MPSRRKISGMRFAGLGVEFAAAVAGLTLLGHWIDRRYDSEPWGLLIGAGIGLVGGMYNMLREALSASQPGKTVTGNEGFKPGSGQDESGSSQEP